MILKGTETPDNSETIDIVDDNDVTIGSKRRDEIHSLGLLHREVHVWLFDKEKNVYFQKSPAHKSSAGLFDASVGGHVDKGEDYITAAVRETKEESGLVIPSVDLVLLNKFRGVSEHKKKGTINNFVRSVFIYKKPVTAEDLTADLNETDGGFHKFSYDFLSKLNNEKAKAFHKFVPTDELPRVINFLNKV